MRAFLTVTIGCLLLMSCAPQQPDMTALRKAIDDYNAASIDAMKTGNSEKALSYYVDDAMEMPPNMAMIKGKAAIKEFQDNMMKSGMKMTYAKFDVIDVQAGGNIATEVGTYDMKMTMGGGPEMPDKGKYIALWKHQQDGSWKVFAETWTSDMPPMSMEQPKETKKKK